MRVVVCVCRGGAYENAKLTEDWHALRRCAPNGGETARAPSRRLPSLRCQHGSGSWGREETDVNRAAFAARRS